MLAHEEPKPATSPAAKGETPERAATTAIRRSAGAPTAPVAPALFEMAATSPDPAGDRGDALGRMLARCVQGRGTRLPAARAGAGRSKVEPPDDALRAPAVSAEPASDAEEDLAGRVGGHRLLQRNGRGSSAPRPPSDHSTITVLQGPTVGQCGAFRWSVNFRLNRPSIAGGWFVQEVRVRQRVTDCHDTPIPAQTHARHFWEAWRVQPGAREDELVANGTFDFADRYSDNSFGLNTKGSSHTRGDVAFYEGLTLPSSFIANNPLTMAADLPSTTRDPHLRGGTVSHRHNISTRWNCCPRSAGAAATPSDTVLSHRRPR